MALSIPARNMVALEEVIAERRHKLRLAMTSVHANGKHGQATIKRLALQIATLEQLRDLGKE